MKSNLVQLILLAATLSFSQMVSAHPPPPGQEEEFLNNWYNALCTPGSEMYVQKEAEELRLQSMDIFKKAENQIGIADCQKLEPILPRIVKGGCAGSGLQAADTQRRVQICLKL
jgi:hypothetical protein